MENKIDNDIKYLQEKWFIIQDKVKIQWYLQNVGLHRLRRYFNVAQGKYQNFDFQDIINAYLFDKEFRMLNLQLIEIIEKKLKNTLILCVPEYLKRENYINIRQGINRNKEEKKTDKRIMYNEKKVIDLKFNDIECKKYFQAKNTILPELFYDKLSFWEAISIFKDLELSQQIQIADEFQIPLHLLKNWFICILDLRNLCSHSSNIFNRSFTKRIQSQYFNTKIWQEETNSYIWYFFILTVINSKIIPEYHWTQRVFLLMEKHWITLKLFQKQKETSHIQLENSEAWEVLVDTVYHNLW